MDLEICAWCPRLCRHVCPVAVATGREAATPSAIATFAWMGGRSPVPAHVAVDLCLGCGACDAHCGAGQRPSEDFRLRAAPVPVHPWRIEGEGEIVEIHVSRRPQSGRFIHSPDALGHRLWKAGRLDLLDEVRSLAGLRLRVFDGDVAEILTAAGLDFERAPAPPGPRFVTCFEGPAPSPGQLACCGRREAFLERSPEAARAVAEENVRRMGGREHSCGDEACAAWLRAHGAEIRGPEHAPTAPPSLR